jgi:hypothetical protein
MPVPVLLQGLLLKKFILQQREYLRSFYGLVRDNCCIYAMLLPQLLEMHLLPPGA